MKRKKAEAEAANDRQNKRSMPETPDNIRNIQYGLQNFMFSSDSKLSDGASFQLPSDHFSPFVVTSFSLFSLNPVKATIKDDKSSASSADISISRSSVTSGISDTGSSSSSASVGSLFSSHNIVVDVPSEPIYLEADADGLVIFSESAKKFDRQEFLHAMVSLVLQYFKEGYITPFLILRGHFTFLKNKYPKEFLHSPHEQFFNQEATSIVNDEMTGADCAEHESALLRKLFSVNFDFTSNTLQADILRDLYCHEEYFEEQESVAEQKTPTKEDVETTAISVSTQLSQDQEHVEAIKKILALYHEKKFDEAAYRAKEYHDQYVFDDKKIFNVEVQGHHVNATLLFFSNYVSLAVELFEKKEHLTFVLFALAELRKLIKFQKYQVIYGEIINIGMKLHHDLMEIIKKKGPGFYERIKIKLESKFAINQFEPDFYHVLDNVVNKYFERKTQQSVFSSLTPFMFQPDVPGLRISKSESTTEGDSSSALTTTKARSGI